LSSEVSYFERRKPKKIKLKDTFTCVFTNVEYVGVEEDDEY